MHFLKFGGESSGFRTRKKDNFGKSSGFPNLEGGLKCLNLRQRRLRKLVLGLE